jgi:hypothetical protein
MRRMVRVIGWVERGLLLAVCLAAVVAWMGLRSDERAVQHLAVREDASGAVCRFRYLACGGGAVVAGQAELVIPADAGGAQRDFLVALYRAEAGWRDARRVTMGAWRWRYQNWRGWAGFGLASSEVTNEMERRSGRAVRCPLWAIALLSGAWPVTSIARAARRWRRARRARREGLCPACGYDWRATPGRCPECGRGREG